MQKHPWTQTVIGSCLAFFVTASWGQPSPAQLQMQQQQQINNMLGEVQTQDTLRRQGVINQQQNAARQQAWQAKENAIQAQIERYRSTPYYGSLAVNSLEAGVYWGGGGNTNRKISEEKAIAICAQNSCKILKTIYNTCAAVSWPANAPQKIIVSTNHDPQLAIQEAGQSCEKQYGAENCRISLNKKTNSYAYCSGYDYGAYRQK
ncbi:DUF4189 domain-containing protein [Brachymonas sp.]|uniref:DUF4189 domain-containing protein n=2 Tax=unclassified Brachymonas TaxID=2621329 RepID=UPI0035B0D9F5